MITNGQNADAGDFVSTSAGAGSSGKVPKLNGSGLLDTSFMAWKGLSAAGTTTHDTSTTTANTIAHGLGVAPKIVRVTAILTSTAGICQTTAVFIGGVLSAISFYGGLGSSTTNTTAQNFYVYTTTASDLAVGTIAVDATNITVSWTKTGSPTGTATLLWEALA